MDNLETGSKIMPNPNTDSEKISKISNADRKLFGEFFAKNAQSLDFSNSWLYTIQSTLFGAYKYFDEESLIAFTTKKPNSKEYAFTQYLGENALEKAFSLGEKLI